ncbi:MAG: phosphotransferase [Desulfobacteraceae bacterium]|nr:phosphotransferase [Desulfobacteraceae bacterium]
MIRANEKTDQIAGKLIAYLRDELNDSTIEYDSPLTQLQGGFETYIYRFKLNGVQKELSKPLILRLYPQSYGTINAIWESTIQNVLAGEGYPVAQAYFTCTDMSVLGGAFFIMDFLPGKPMITAPIETIPGILGKAHAALHGIDPEPLIKSLNEQGIDENQCRLNNRFDSLQNIANELSWIRDGVDWLMENRPPEPERLAVCHGDFHPLNILIQDGKITGVLDWPTFLIADPALDIANTIVVTTIPSKHLASTVEQDFSSADWEMTAELYLDAYRLQRLLDSTHLDYYRVMRSVNALIQGFEGQKIWQHPLIVKDLIEFIQKVTEIRITMPD